MNKALDASAKEEGEIAAKEIESAMMFLEVVTTRKKPSLWCPLRPSRFMSHPSRRAGVMKDPRLMRVPALVSGSACASTQVDLFKVEEELLIEDPDIF